jgi:hypothetical protein
MLLGRHVYYIGERGGIVALPRVKAPDLDAIGSR